MTYSLKIHKAISMLGFVLLIGVLFYLTYNTFRLKDEQYLAVEKSRINERYTQSIRNDKLFPGGVSIIDRHLMSRIHELEALYDQDRAVFEQTTHQLLDSMFRELRAARAMDSLFAAIKTEYELDDDVEYLLTVNSIQLVFKNMRLVTIYRSSESYPFVPDQLNTPYGVYIAGALQTPLPQNQIINLMVSSTSDYTYWMGFTLHADHRNRTWRLIKLMTPTFLLALFAIGCVVSIYYVTYRNWLQQKKLAEMKSDFVNSITHEFNTPLSTIIVANKNMQNDRILADPNNIRPLTKIIERQSLRLKKLFEQVMDITTMDSASLQKEPYELNQLLEEIVTDYRIKVTGQHVTLLAIPAQQPLIIDLNRFFFTTMLFNLFDNAIKYNQNDHKRIVVDATVSSGSIHLRIADNGIGIPEDQVEHIFEKFYRVQKKGSQHVSGLGLGLYYTYQCIKSHGWTLSVVSEEAVGSQFTIHIPYKS